MTAAYKESFEEPDATTRYRTAGPALQVEGVENLISKKKAKKAVNRPFRVLTANVRSGPGGRSLVRRGARGPAAQRRRRRPRVPAGDRRPLPTAGEARRSRVPDWDVFYGKDPQPRADRLPHVALLDGHRCGHVAPLAATRPARSPLHDPPSAQVQARWTPTFTPRTCTWSPARSATPRCPAGTNASRVWNDGIAKHRASWRASCETGLPVVGGGDYNRR